MDAHEFAFNVLVAEDHPLNQEVLKVTLERLGCNVALADDGQAAFSLFMENHFDVVFMDCQMPVLDGFETTAQIRSYEREHDGAATPIVAITGNVADQDIEKCYQAGMNFHIAKPFKKQALIDILSQFSPKAPNHSSTLSQHPRAEDKAFLSLDAIKTRTQNNPKALLTLLKRHHKKITELTGSLSNPDDHSNLAMQRSTFQKLKVEARLLGAHTLEDLCKNAESRLLTTENLPPQQTKDVIDHSKEVCRYLETLM